MVDKILVSPLDLALTLIGTTETPGSRSTAIILAMLQSVNSSVTDDEVAWCSALPNFIFGLLKLPRSKSLRARSWLNVGTSVPLINAEPGFDLCIFKRGEGPQPDKTVLDAPGHVAFFVADLGNLVRVFGGNQSDAIGYGRFPVEDLLDIRRIVAVQPVNIPVG